MLTGKTRVSHEGSSVPRAGGGERDELATS